MSTLCYIVLNFVFLLYLNGGFCLENLAKLEGGPALQSTVANLKHVMVLFCQDEGKSCANGAEVVQFVSDRVSIEEIKSFVLYDANKATDYNFKELPQLVFYRNGQPILYPGRLEVGDEIVLWFQENLEVFCKDLSDDNFEHDTQAATGATTGDWFVMFYDSENCPGTLPVWETVASKLKQRVNVAKVDTKTSPKLVDRFKLTECLTFKFFRLGLMYDYIFKPTNDVMMMVTFAENWYKNSKSEKVPMEPSPFDKVAEEAAAFLKDTTAEPRRTPLVLGICGAVVALILVIILVMAKRKQKAKFY